MEVFGRVDYSLSSGIKRKLINKNESVMNSILKVSEKAKDSNLDLVVGGAISVDAIEILKRINQIKLDRFETRKVIFSKETLELNDLKSGMLKAVQFELYWLKNKKKLLWIYFREDDIRIKMLSDRWER